MSDEKITVGSRVLLNMHLVEPMPQTDKPGEVPPLRSMTINGGGKKGRPEGWTHDVDADLFRKWMEANKFHPAVVQGMIREVPQSEVDAGEAAAVEYGFEPGLDRVAEESAGEASKGSTIKHDGPVTSGEMAAESHMPNDDSPRSQSGHDL